MHRGQLLMTKKYKVAILGYGEMGHAMHHLLSANHECYLWDKYPDDGVKVQPLQDIIPLADFILFCLPVNPHREIIQQIKPLLKLNSICISIAKGLDESGQTATQIFDDVLDEDHFYALVYGPMISEEIIASRYAFAQLGCSQASTCENTLDLFSHTRLLLESTDDITGISWSVILKNVYALLFGMADELQLGDNMRGFLAVEALQELDKIVSEMGGESGSPYHLAGLGDLITTSTSEDSFHHNLGRELARGDRGNVTGEGVHTLKMVDKHQIFEKQNYPLFNLVFDIVSQPVNVKNELHEYITKKYIS